MKQDSFLILAVFIIGFESLAQKTEIRIYQDRLTGQLTQSVVLSEKDQKISQQAEEAPDSLFQRFGREDYATLKGMEDLSGCMMRNEKGEWKVIQKLRIVTK